MPILGVIDSAKSGNQDSGAMFAIASTTVNSGVTNITFTSIPSTYTHLEIRWSAQTNRGTYNLDDLIIQVGNGSVDTGANYSNHQIIGSGSAVTANSNTNLTYGYAQGQLGTTVGNTFGVGVTTILDYANTNKFKTGRTIGLNDTNGQASGFNGWVGLDSFAWRSKSVIDTIKFTMAQGTNFTTGTRISIYGIKG